MSGDTSECSPTSPSNHKKKKSHSKGFVAKNNSVIGGDSPKTYPNEIVRIGRGENWTKSFAKSDPRWSIMRFFQNFVMKYEVKDNPGLLLINSHSFELKGDIVDQRPAAFSVWRTTSMASIRMMMTGKGTGKGLDIKGKSAMRGKLSGYVPFVQIHNNDLHKKMVGTCPPDTRTRIFFSSEKARDEVRVKMKKVMLDMMEQINEANEAMRTPNIDEDEYEDALRKMIWKMKHPKVTKIDDYSPNCWGVEVPERLLYEAYVMRGDCTRVKGSNMDTGRPSEPQFFYMNLSSTRDSKKKPRAVIWQHDAKNPMDPMSLLMAYEENNSVTPVVSDFDPFLVGTRGVPYKKPLHPEQVKILQWCVEEIDGILKQTNITGNWTRRWLRVLKNAAKNGFHPEIPHYGFGDPMSYSIVKNAVKTLSTTGAVRHGAECFNFYFPQALDEEFLIICPDYFGDLPYKYVSQYELRRFLIDQVDHGFTFPIHPKWVLCDPGWLNVWNKLCASDYPFVQESLDAWYPPESGIRERIREITIAFPRGLICSKKTKSTEDMNLAMLELKRYKTLQRAKSKLHAITTWARNNYTIT